MVTKSRDIGCGLSGWGGWRFVWARDWVVVRDVWFRGQVSIAV